MVEETYRFAPGVFTNVSKVSQLDMLSALEALTDNIPFRLMDLTERGTIAIGE